jgi:hypothetical protein
VSKLFLPGFLEARLGLQVILAVGMPRPLATIWAGFFEAGISERLPSRGPERDAGPGDEARIVHRRDLGSAEAKGEGGS